MEHDLKTGHGHKISLCFSFPLEERFGDNMYKTRGKKKLTSSKSSSGVAGVLSVLKEAMDDVSESMESSS